MRANATLRTNISSSNALADPDDLLEVYKRHIASKAAIPRAARTIRYQERVLAFLDILGWSKLISDSVHDPAALRRLAGLQISLNLDHELQIQDPDDVTGECMTHFSDCFVLSWPAPGSQQALDRVLFSLAETIWNLFLNRFLVRGGVARGKLFHKPQVVFGPSLVEAYRLESETAIYPRVLISDSLGRKSTSPLIRRDADGLFFVDFLALGRDEKWFGEFLNQVRHFLVGEYKNFDTNLTVRTKYGWMINYFNVIVAEARMKGVRPISLH